MLLDGVDGLDGMVSNNRIGESSPLRDKPLTSRAG